MNIFINFAKKAVKLCPRNSFDEGVKDCISLGKKLITKKNVDRFLDLGCSDGKLTKEFAKTIKSKEIWGIEILPQRIRAAKSKGIKCLKADLNYKWPLESNYFDIILSSQNIEHVHNTAFYLLECYRCLKPNGQLIILTENLASFANLFALFFGWQPFSCDIGGWLVGNPLMKQRKNAKDIEKLIKKCQRKGLTGSIGHIKVLSFQGLQDSLELVGFRDIKMFTRGYVPLYGWLSDLLCSIDKKRGYFLIASAIKK